MANLRNTKQVITVPKMLVDTPGAGYTCDCRRRLLRELRLKRVQKDRSVFQMANGETITLAARSAMPGCRPGTSRPSTKVVFGQPGDLPLLGARTLEDSGAHRSRG